jgi:hypothetical protein
MTNQKRDQRGEDAARIEQRFGRIHRYGQKAKLEILLWFGAWHVQIIQFVRAKPATCRRSGAKARNRSR